MGHDQPHRFQTKENFTLSSSLPLFHSTSAEATPRFVISPYVKDEEEKEIALLVSSCLSTAVQLDKYPKSEIYIHILVLEDDGG